MKDQISDLFRMEVLPSRGEAEINKRTLEVEPVPPFNEESDITIKELEDTRKGYGHLEKRPKLDVTPDVAEETPNNDMQTDEDILDAYGYVIFSDEEEEEEEAEEFYETKDNWKPEDFLIIKKFITEEQEEGRQLKILQRATRIRRAVYEEEEEEKKKEEEEVEEEEEEEEETPKIIFGASVIATWFDDYHNDILPSKFLSKFNLDAKTLKSHLRGTSKYMGTPNWENLAKYVKQLTESEGFDLDVYKGLKEYTENLPKGLSKKAMLGSYTAKVLEECMKAAVEFYEEAGGGKLEEAKLEKASERGGSMYDRYYITFSAKSSLDGKRRTYQARVVYDGYGEGEDGEPGVDKRRIMVRLKKEVN